MEHNEARGRAEPCRRRGVCLCPQSHRKPWMGFRPWGGMKGPCWLLGREGPRGAPVAVGGPGGKPATSPTPLMQSGRGGAPKAPESLFGETSKELTCKACICTTQRPAATQLSREMEVKQHFDTISRAVLGTSYSLFRCCLTIALAERGWRPPVYRSQEIGAQRGDILARAVSHLVPSRVQT